VATDDRLGNPVGDLVAKFPRGNDLIHASGPVRRVDAMSIGNETVV
jgi:hypothetical protein